MRRFTVYSKDGQTVRCVLDKLEYTGVFMAERACTSTFISDVKINFDVFDYIDYRGERFELELLPTVKKISKHQYSYDLNFVSLKYELERCMMRNIVPSDNGIVYPTPLVVEFTGTVKYLAERIQACLDAMYGKGVWSITLADGVDSEEKNISMSNQNCWSALSLVNTEYKLNYFVKGRSVTIGGAEPVVNNVFEYGKGKGLYEIKRISDADTGIVTKLRAYGGTRNLDYSYPKKPEWTDSILPANYALSPLRLMLPSFKTDGVTDFVLASNEAIAKYGIREGVITYDDIYPSITGMKNSAGQAIDEIKSVDAITSETQPTFTVQLYDLGFDLNESYMPEAQLSMKSGALQGYAFAIAKIVKASDGSYTLTLGRNTLEEADTDNFTVPNKDWNMKAGDKFVLLNILMPQEYIRAAENRLLERAKEYIAKYSSTNYSYNIGVDEIFMARNANFYNEIMEGKRLTVNDPEMGIDHENVIIQSLSIKEGEGLIPTFEVTLNNEPSASTLERIQGQISEIETSVNNKFSSQSELSKQYRKKLDKVVWDRNLEERVDDNGKEYLFLTKPLITAYGVTMYAGADVQVPSIYEGLPIDGVTIQWVDGRLVATGGKGTANGIVVNGNTYTPNEDGIITLPNYPTSLEWGNISGKPSWIGSTKPSYSWDEIGGKPSVFPTNWENVSDKPSWIGATKPAYDFSELSSHPTTLGGYGITDAVTIDTAQEIYGIKEFANTVYISTASDTMLAFKSLDDENFAIIDVRNKTGNSLSKFGYYGDRWAIDSNTILHTGNYAGELDNHYVNKAGDTMTGYLFFNANSGIDLVSIPGYKSAISINNMGADRIGINFTDGDGNLRIAKTDINRDWISGDVNILLGSNNYKVWHAGNDGSGSGLDADLLDGKHLYQGQWDSICYIGEDGVLEIGKYIDFHEEQGMSNDFSCRIMTQGDYQNTLFLPTSGGTLATLGDNVASATKLQTPRTIFSKPFDGTNNVTGGAKFVNICIETDNNGNDSGRGSEINNYNSALYLQYVSPNNLICCMGGGNVGIGTTSPSYKLHVTGSLMCEGEWIRNTGDYGWYNATHGGGIYMEDSTWVKVYNNKHFQCKGTIFGYRYTTNNNAAAFSFDKPGSYMAGIGSGGSDSLVRLGPCDSTGEWYDWGGQTWQLYGNFLTTGGITMYSDLRKKNVLNSIIVPLDVMANADLFDYTFKTDEKCKVRAGTSAQYWNVFLPQVTDTDNEGFFTMSYDVLATTCVLSMAKHFQRFLIEDFNNHETRIEFLERENKELKDSNKEMMNRIIELERRAA